MNAPGELASRSGERTEALSRSKVLWWAQRAYIPLLIGSLVGPELLVPLWVLPSWVFIWSILRARHPRGVLRTVFGTVAIAWVLVAFSPDFWAPVHRDPLPFWAIGLLAPLVCVPFGRSRRLGETVLRLLAGALGSGVWIVAWLEPLSVLQLPAALTALFPFYVMESGSLAYEALRNRRVPRRSGAIRAD